MTGAPIRAARGFLNWSVRDLGKKTKVHFNTVHAIEHGKSHGKPETLAAIRKALEKVASGLGCDLKRDGGPNAETGVRLRPRPSSHRTAY